MYNNIGEKIKKYARALFIVEAIFSIIAGLVFIDYEILIALLIMIVGPLLAWVGSWFTYGFGEIIVKLCEIEKHTTAISQNIKNTSTQNRIETSSQTVSKSNTYKSVTHDNNDNLSFYQTVNSSDLPADIKEKIKEIKSLKDQKIISEQECRNRVNNELNGIPLSTALRILNKL